MDQNPGYGILKVIKQNDKPINKWNSLQRVIFTLSDTTQEFQSSKLASDDPVEIGCQIALYLDKLRLEQSYVPDLGLEILTRIYSFGLAQCFRARECKQKGSESATPSSYPESLSDVGYERFSSVPKFADRISSGLSIDGPRSKTIQNWIKNGNLWCRDVELLGKGSPPELMPLGFICLPTSTDQLVDISYSCYTSLPFNSPYPRWVKQKTCDRQKGLQELSENSTQRHIVDFLTTVVNNLWHWKFGAS
jgi:hypothetical protein